MLVGRAVDGRAQFGHLSLPIADDVPHDEGGRSLVLFRPEHVTISMEEPEPDVPNLGRGTIIEQSFVGAERGGCVYGCRVSRQRARSHLRCHSEKKGCS